MQVQAPSESTARYDVLFIGLGSMGAPMARHLARCPFVSTCFVHNRTTNKAKQHALMYSTHCMQHLSNLSAISMLFTCLPTSLEVEQIIVPLAAALPRDAIVIDCTSGDPARTRAIGAILHSHGVHMLDAAVSGGPSGAENGQLSVIVGGEVDILARAQPLLQSFSRAITHVGPLGCGHAVKAMNNILYVSHLALASEALCALTNMKIDPAVALTAINLSSGRSFMTEQRIPQEVLTRRFSYGFSLGLMHKDVSVANRILDDYFPEAALLRATQRLSAEALSEFDISANETTFVQLMEQKAHAVLQPFSSAACHSPLGGTVLHPTTSTAGDAVSSTFSSTSTSTVASRDCS